MTISEQKKSLRTQVRKLERELSPTYKKATDQVIIARICALPEYQAANTVFCFVGTEREIDTVPLMEDIVRRGKRLLVPRCTGPGIMELRQIIALSQLSAGAYGILEPQMSAPVIEKTEVDFAVIPCVCGDRHGHRLGQGGGYYDRFFEKCSVPSVLVCREAMMQEQIPVEKHDVIFDRVVTEVAVYE